MTLETRAPDRQVPFDEAAEQQVIGSLLIDRDAIFKVADLLRVDDFYIPRNQRIYDVAQALLERRERIDPLTVQVELARREELDRAGGQAYLRALADAVPTAVEIERYARIVRDRAILRRLLGAATSIAADAYDEPTDIALALDRAEQRLFALRDESANAQLRHITASLQSNYEHLTERMERPFEVSGIPSGFREIDYYTEGFTTGDLVVLAARPSVGKTSLALAMSFNIARRGRPVLLFSLEMDAKQIVSRFLALNSRMDLLALRTGNIIDTDAAAALHGVPILIDDTPGISIMELRTKARRAISHEKIEVIVVDYIQLIRTGDDDENRVQEIATITRNLKSLARGHDARSRARHQAAAREPGGRSVAPRRDAHGRRPLQRDRARPARAARSLARAAPHRARCDRPRGRAQRAHRLRERAVRARRARRARGCRRPAVPRRAHAERSDRGARGDVRDDRRADRAAASPDRRGERDRASGAHPRGQRCGRRRRPGAALHGERVHAPSRYRSARGRAPPLRRADRRPRRSSSWHPDGARVARQEDRRSPELRPHPHRGPPGTRKDQPRPQCRRARRGRTAQDVCRLLNGDERAAGRAAPRLDARRDRREPPAPRPSLGPGVHGDLGRVERAPAGPDLHRGVEPPHRDGRSREVATPPGGARAGSRGHRLPAAHRRCGGRREPGPRGGAHQPRAQGNRARARGAGDRALTALAADRAARYRADAFRSSRKWRFGGRRGSRDVPLAEGPQGPRRGRRATQAREAPQRPDRRLRPPFPVRAHTLPRSRRDARDGLSHARLLRRTWSWRGTKHAGQVARESSRLVRME